MSGTNSRRHLILWKYNSSGCLTTLKNKCAMESLTYSKLIIINDFNISFSLLVICFYIYHTRNMEEFQGLNRAEYS